MFKPGNPGRQPGCLNKKTLELQRIKVRFELGKDAKHIKERLAGRGAGIDRLFRSLQHRALPARSASWKGSPGPRRRVSTKVVSLR